MNDDNLIPLSYISQYNYCKRRVGLLMLEQLWNESSDTAKGRMEHKNVHTASIESKGKITVISDLHVVSNKIQLIGKCDSVEAIKDKDGYIFPFLDDEKYILYPIEYKHGKIRDETEYELQLCAQAMCIEEMYNCIVEKGAVFYISSHRRQEVIFDESKRAKVIETSSKLSEMLNCGIIPNPKSSSKCTKCSMKDICMPDILTSAKNYMKKIYSEFNEEEVL